MSRGLREDEVARRNLRAVQGGLPSLLPLQEGLGMKLNRLGAGLLHLGGFALLLVSVAEPTWSQVDYGGSSLVTYPSPWLLCFGQTCLKRPSSVLGEFSRAFLTLSLLFSGLLSLALLTLTLCQYQPVMLSEQQLPAAGANFVIVDPQLRDDQHLSPLAHLHDCFELLLFHGGWHSSSSHSARDLECSDPTLQPARTHVSSKG
ncbi:uncharacterized protein LOC119946131 isoform X2 [Tachyglossus aculeatus]|uniref:uncharacterized protein LOC119946131 isoform X2 n=1 Tax=Tachyglossus aculeatus TaxID=9261 RepID=UPI0018F784AF|nr:uncharacterized protein LOC119946131 isoform X2 [Tachyglossus aculeatus]